MDLNFVDLTQPTVFPLTYDDIVKLIATQAGADTSSVVTAFNNAGLTPDIIYGGSASMLRNYGLEISYSSSGLAQGAYLTRGYQGSTSDKIWSTIEELNSNTGGGIVRGTLQTPINTTIDSATGTTIWSTLNGGVPMTAPQFLFGEVAPAVAAASAGITLGKTIDSVLYNLNPDFWDAHNMSSLNPETWGSITAGDDSFLAGAFNYIFGIDPETGNAQAYMDENALAYLAQYMYQNGVFSDITVYPTFANTGNVYISGLIPIASIYNDVISKCPFTYNFSDDGLSTLNNFLSTYADCMGVVSLYIGSGAYGGSSPLIIYAIPDLTIGSTVTLGRTLSNAYRLGTVGNKNQGANQPMRITSVNVSSTSLDSGYNIIGTRLVSGGIEINASNINTTVSSSINGIGTQSGATTPNLDGITTVPDTLTALQQQYPDLWNNSVPYSVVNPDGTVTTRNYVPVGWPNISSYTDTQPTTGDQSQTNTLVDPLTATKELIETLTKTLTQPDTDTGTPTNPPDTGDGTAPTPTPATGSASSLWAIYHPTQAEVDSFGSWLWSSDFIDQIQKIFNNPMESIIGLHKVYATPVDAGTRTIKVGYLDSGVSSAYITQQYVEVDCGSVKLNEYFGNVFDYDPYTRVMLYLPFCGIVQLNTGDVMRSTIGVKYGVDVLTGACLAMVSVNRDGGGGVLYQYAGNCAVQYPISSGSYMGIVTGIASVAAGIAGAVATGGAILPAAAGAAGAIMNSHTTVQHSGGFSGNAGAMGGKKPYLIIVRPQTKVAANFPELQGYPTNTTVTLGDCSGFVRVKSVHVDTVPATGGEREQIETILKAGVTI